PSTELKKDTLEMEMKEAKSERKEKKNGSKRQRKTCEEMVTSVLFNPKLFSRPLQNGVDFLLVGEHKKTVKLKNNEWTEFKFGVYLIGDEITVTADCDGWFIKDLGQVKINTSHLWIKHHTSTIDCSGLGHHSDSGPGKGGIFTGIGKKQWYVGGGAGHGSKGAEFDLSFGCGHGKGGDVYGEETLLKQMFCGSGGGSSQNENGVWKGGRGGGIIHLVVQQQLINGGTLRCDGLDGESHAGGGGSGGSILIQLHSSSDTCPHTLGAISCKGGNVSGGNEGGCGRIAIYGSQISDQELKLIAPLPFCKLQK
ncbi:hypothetical protein RFI_37157, partial [Reticulomyxa filosa]